MRDIKFRGKRTDALAKGEWVYGMPTFNRDCTVIDKIEEPTKSGGICRLVDPATVGQYTGLKDKNGKEIYEGDVVERIWTDYYDTETQTEPLQIGDKCGEGVIIALEQDDDGWGILSVRGNPDVVTLERFRFWLKNEHFGYEGEDLQEPSDYVVVGNRWDTPDTPDTPEGRTET